MENVSSIGGSNEFTISNFQMKTLMEIVGSSQKGCQIKDLRVIDGIYRKIKSHLSPSPKVPERRTLGDGEIYSKEENEEFEKALNEFRVENEAWPDKESAISFSNSELNVLKIKMQKFDRFFSEELPRERILNLYDKFGL
jgi:hypothetical protein